MPRHFKIDDVLGDVEHAAAVELAARRETTVDALHIWLRARGHKVSRAAAGNWLRMQRARASNPTAALIDRLRGSTFTAEAVAAVHRLLDELARDSRAARVSSTAVQTSAEAP